MFRLQNITRTLAPVAALLVIVAAAPRAHAQESLVSWGSNEFGQVSGTPAGTFSAVSASYGQTVAIRADGTLASWGRDFAGVVSGTPAGTFTAVAASSSHCVAIKTDGTLISWGNNNNGQVSGTPAGTFSAVAAGGLHTVAIRANGTLVSWGLNNLGQVSGTPAGTFSSVAAGSSHSVAIRTDGTLVSWGWNQYGQVSGTPAGTFTAVAAGGRHSVAIRTDGTLVSWGDNTYGQVSGTPAGTFSFVAAGFFHSVAIRPDGTLVSWGDNTYGQLSGTPAGIFSYVSAAFDHSVAIGVLDNQPPLATDDFYGMIQATSLSVPVPGTLANDTDADEDALTIQLVTGPAHAASFQFNPDGSFTYAPPPYFYGEDTFTYRAYDGSVYSEVATVHITVRQPGSEGFITGGGKFFQDQRACTFGFVAKVQGSGVQGQLEFQDHGASVDVRSEAMQGVYAPNQIDGYFSGSCRLNGVNGYTFFVQVHDRGQPGSNDDLAIWVFDSSNNTVYTAGASLAGGNIVIHGN